MRTLCLALILLNALYFAWAQLIDSNMSNMDLVRSDVVRPPPIVLASEAEVSVPKPRASALADQESDTPKTKPAAPQQTSAITPPPQAARVPTADSYPCTSVGPFPSLMDASQAQAALRAVGFTPKQRFEQGGEMWAGYWVSLQNLGTPKKAEATLKMLKGNGITDIYLVPGANPPNTLSLGVFSDYQRAQKRMEQMRALGLEPSLEDRKRAAPVYWIDVDILQPGQSIDTSIFQNERGKIMRLELRECPQTQAAIKTSSRSG
jgi:hypothetical protein